MNDEFDKLIGDHKEVWQKFKYVNGCRIACLCSRSPRQSLLEIDKHYFDQNKEVDRSFKMYKGAALRAYAPSPIVNQSISSPK